MGGGHSGGGHGGGSFGGGGFSGGRGGGFGGGPRPGGFGGGPRGPRRGWYGPRFYWGPRFFWGPGWGWGWGFRGFIMPFIWLSVFLVIIFFVAFAALFSRPDSAGITRSTRDREPLNAAYVTVIDEYYHDGAGCIDTAVKQHNLKKSLQNFYARTGVQPYLYIDDDLDGNKYPSYTDVENFMYSKYDALFSDEGHLLVLYFEYPNGEYNTWWICGDNAIRDVMDNEACEILLDYIDYHYGKMYGHGDYSELFCASFDSAAERIMGGKTSPFENMSAGSILILIIAVGGGVALIVYFIVKFVQNRKDGGNGGGSDGDGMSREDRRKEKYRRQYGGM